MYNRGMLAELPRPVIFAHRGAAARAPENTLAAFELALAEGAEAVELDAKLTSDGQIVVFHDQTLERTTNGTGRLTHRTLDDLRALDAGSYFSEKYRGEKIPLLSEVFEAVGRKLLINVELTNYATPRDDLVPRVCALVQQCGLEDHVLFSSFFPRNLAIARRLLPGTPRALLARQGLLGAWSRSFGFFFGDYTALHPFVSDVNAQQVQRVHRLKRRIHVWTVSEAEQMRRLQGWGVDGIFTKDPALAVQVLRRSA